MYTLNKVKIIGLYERRSYIFKRHKGFTLIELLAVIIILAIVALIATPIILNVIEDAKISAGRSEANMILGGINNYCATEDVKAQMDEDYVRICTSSLDAEKVKEMVNLGNATIESIKYNGSKLTELIIKSNNHTFSLCQIGQFVMDEECPKFPASLISLLLEQYSEENQVGLVKDSDNDNLYYYKGSGGQVANNYLWYGGHQWRVLEFDTSNNTLTLITQQPLTAIQPASTGWESEEAYESSYINTWLNEYFWNSLDSGIQRNILNNVFNVGIYGETESDYNIREITTTKKVGLLDVEQYMRAGGKNSFLDIKEYWWLGNRNDPSYVRFVYADGRIASCTLDVSNGVRAVIKISDLTITKGDGTLTNNFQVEKTSTNTNDVQVGEYINVPYNGSDDACGNDNMCTFRVVSKNNDSIKVVLNGLISNTSAWADNASDNITISDTIYDTLKLFIDNIDSKYITTGTYGVGMYANKNSYTIPSSTTITTNVGLPTIGEMFSGNDIDLGTSDTKLFVDINTIENPIVLDWYWTMNRYNSTYIRLICGDGYISSSNSLDIGGVRPTIYLKSETSSLNFSGGEGTAQSPYILQ